MGRREREGERRSVKKEAGESEHALAAFCASLESPSLLCQNRQSSNTNTSSTTKTPCAISDLQTQTASSSPPSSPPSSANAQISSSPASSLATPESPSDSLSTPHQAVVESPGRLARRVVFSIESALAKSYHSFRIRAGRW
jgi:hypothetical protein